MCDVAHVGEVEEVLVVAELEAGLVLRVSGQTAGDRLHVAFAKDGGGADGTGQEGGEFSGAVCSQDVGFGDCLRRMSISSLEAYGYEKYRTQSRGTCLGG